MPSLLLPSQRCAPLQAHAVILDESKWKLECPASFSCSTWFDALCALPGGTV